MPLKELLKEEHWAGYDNKKIIDARDRNFFACTEQWEVDYLKNLIRNKHSDFSDNQILIAIRYCCANNQAPHARKTFVGLVLKKLGIIN